MTAIILRFRYDERIVRAHRIHFAFLIQGYISIVCVVQCALCIIQYTYNRRTSSGLPVADHLILNISTIS